ncbi:MAG: glycogen debranching protein GlgX [Spirochaetaceae bacterium]|nr:glycogen debranching protein GlgX [Spirochaetaceae bacterium]
MSEITILQGKPLPHGAELTQNGVNFSIFSRHATSVTLNIFEHEDDADPCFSYTLDEKTNRIGDVWFVELQGVSKGALYLYQVDGPYNPKKGLRFDKRNYLIDPYAKALTNNSAFLSVAEGHSPTDDLIDSQRGQRVSAKDFPKCVVVDDHFDWQGDRPLNYPLRETVLYETHLKGFTANPNSLVAHPGTYKGFIEKIPYLKKLGITSVELLPIQEFDENENSNINPKTGEKLKNYWGYSTIAFFAPKASYAANKAPGAVVSEFKEMVREMHKNGLEVILDIVFNHTAEGNEKGLSLSFRGLDNSIYYILEEKDKSKYTNYSGCGNTVNCNHPIVRDFIIDCLRYWVCEMHVDGFRFDLGSILGRDQNGRLMENPPVLERIAEDPVLRNTKIIAEAWDAAGAYQVGEFPGGRWCEWNDRFRDDMRRFWRGDGGLINEVATRLTGSSDLYSRDGRKPSHSVNFITSHDGFTLNDLVSYNGKHNEENGEENRDGSDNNYSYNYGYEGVVSNEKIQKMRTQQIKNFMVALLLSQGTPMILGGDEIRRSQDGNNNAYCQDTLLSWYDWDNLEKYKEEFRFISNVIHFRKNHPAFRRGEFFEGKDHSFNQMPDITWFDEKAKLYDWSKNGDFIAFILDGSWAEIQYDHDDNDFYVMINGSDKDITVTIPPALGNKKWFRVIDTGALYPEDFLVAGEEEMLPNQARYVLQAHSCGILLSK